MSVKRIIAVAAIYALACMGWVILGTATTVRSTELFNKLGSRVEKLWGDELVQQAPSFASKKKKSSEVEWLMPARSDLKVSLHTDYRKKGLIWYPTYNCSFDGIYTITNNNISNREVRINYTFPAKSATYDNFIVSLDGERIETPVNITAGINETFEIKKGESKEFRIAYKTRGIWSWRYRLDANVGRVQNLSLTMNTNFEDIDYTEGSLSPMSTVESGDGVLAVWDASDLITSADIGVIIPEKINPGPLTTRITFFAPVCLIFFFVLIATINILYKVDIHPMHYLFVASGFFAFHLLLSYMVGIINVHGSSIISAIVSVALVTSYLRAALGETFPWKMATAGQLFFLVLFSYSFFLKGTTGLTVAIGSVVTLGVLMRVTAHIKWSEVFDKNQPKRQGPPALPAQPATITPDED